MIKMGSKRDPKREPKLTKCGPEALPKEGLKNHRKILDLRFENALRRRNRHFRTVFEAERPAISEK